MREIYISEAKSRKASTWHNRKITWSELVQRCSETTRTAETYEEYKAMSKDEQSNIKDVGGFVGGYLTEGKRRNGFVKFRNLITLDIDYATEGSWEACKAAYPGTAMLCYTTHKHSANNRRLRIVAPLDKSLNATEYEAAARSFAHRIGMEIFDDSTYEPARLFYWPSTAADGDFFFAEQVGEAVSADKLLAAYFDAADMSEWFYSEREEPKRQHEIRKAGDPREKQNLVGAFCQAHSIEDAIETYLCEVYAKGKGKHRYTYLKGSTANGLVTYDGLFAWSNHDTDPAGKRLCNAFDLVRIHRFGDLDKNVAEDTAINRLPSYAMMEQLCASDKATQKALAERRRANAGRDFAEVGSDEVHGTEDVISMLPDLDKKGNPQSTIQNIVVILSADTRIAGKLRHNIFADRYEVSGELPWKREQSLAWSDTDDANLRVWLSTEYGIQGKDKILDALASVLSENTYHPVRDYFGSLKWDGTPRLDTLLIDYLGAADSDIVRAFTRKHLTAAVTRIYRPGAKYDQCLVLSGPEGCGKSSLIRLLSQPWFVDGLGDITNKDSLQMLQGAIFVEQAELAAYTRSDVEADKAFLSRTCDTYRAAYARRVAEHPRQCVIWATTNEENFLKGETGNRRYWVVTVDPTRRKADNLFEAIPAIRDQVWAEAVHRYREGESLLLSSAEAIAARALQDAHNEIEADPLKNEVEQWLATSIPQNWDDFDLSQRRRFYAGQSDPLSAKTVPRQYATGIEFCCEFLTKDRGDREIKTLLRRFAAIMKSYEATWQRVQTTRHAVRLYGTQRGYKNVKMSNDEEEEL